MYFYVIRIFTSMKLLSAQEVVTSSSIYSDALRYPLTNVALRNLQAGTRLMNCWNLGSLVADLRAAHITLPKKAAQSDLLGAFSVG